MLSAYRKLLLGDPSGIIESIYSVCTSPWQTFNKPPFMFATFQGGFIPYSSFVCKDSELAKKEDAINEAFIPTSESAIRSEASNQMRRIQHSLNFKFHQLLVDARNEGANDQQISFFRKLWGELLELKGTFVHASVAKKSGGGNCSEHSKIASADLITLKYNKHIHEILNGVTSFKIQEVNFFGHLDGHALVFINSNLPDIRITNDAQAVVDLFKNATGINCDSWNNGIVANLEVDLTGIANPANYNGYGYTGVTIVTREIPLKTIADLPPKFRAFFCEVLEDMGINMRNALQALKDVEALSVVKKPKLKPKRKKIRKIKQCKNSRPAKTVCPNQFSEFLTQFLPSPAYRNTQCLFQPHFLPYPQTCANTPQGLMNAGFGNLLGR